MKVILTDLAKKQHKKLPKSEQRKINKKLILLSVDSLAGKKLFGEFEDSRSLRAWPYRILYIIKEKKQEVWITSILHRQGVYK